MLRYLLFIMVLEASSRETRTGYSEELFAKSLVIKSRSVYKGKYLREKEHWINRTEDEC